MQKPCSPLSIGHHIDLRSEIVSLAKMSTPGGGDQSSPSRVRSCLYEGTVFHRRLRDPEHTHSALSHAFSYPLFYAYVDLDSYDDEMTWGGLGLLQGSGIASFSPADHLRRGSVAAAVGESKIAEFGSFEARSCRDLARQGMPCRHAYAVRVR